MQFAKNRIERLKVMGFKNIARYLASFFRVSSSVFQFLVSKTM